MTPRGSASWSSRRAPRSPDIGQCGFTFLEILIALAICGLTLSAVSASLLAIFSGEQLNRRLQDEGLALQTLATRHPLQAGTPILDNLFDGAWSVERETATTGEGAQAEVWIVYRLWGGAPAGAGPRMAVRARLAPSP